MEKLKVKYAEELARFAEQKAAVRRLWNVEEKTAALLYFITASHKAKYVVEIGTSNGFSTFWLALAAKENKGKVHTFEVEETRYKMARENLAKRDNVVFHFGLAEDTLGDLESGIDLVFIDAGKPAYYNYLMLIKDKLITGAVILADNVLSHPETTESYNAFVRDSEDFFNLVLPIEAGLSISIYNPKL